MGSCLSSADDRQRNPHSPMTPGGLLRGRKGSRKRHGSFGSSSFNSRNDLLAVHGRMYQNGASRLASMFTQQGKKGPNQDAMIIWENFGSKDDMVFCGVFDGHGPYGHLVARKVRDSLPSKLSAQWDVQTESDDLRNAAGSMNSEDTASICLDEERSYIDPEEREAPPEIFIKMRESFLRAFKVMDKELKVHPKIDCYCSGTTAVTILKQVQGQDLIIGNIGDSRAVLGTRDEDENLIAIQLTVDLKPNLPGEAERIRRCRGRVFALQDEPEVARVWLPNNNSPGLAMARAFGDFCLKDFGLISVPEVTYRHITDKDEFVVLATDGVWDVLSNSEVVEIVASAPTRSSAARTLVESAVRSWRYKYPTSKVDDCAVVCLFLNPDPSDSTTSSCCDTKELIDSSGPLADDDVHRDDPVPIGLDRSGTVRATSEILQEEPRGSPRQVSMVNSQKRLQSKAGGPESQDWSALEGVSRVNTLLTLPRFVQGGSDKQATESKRK